MMPPIVPAPENCKIADLGYLKEWLRETYQLHLLELSLRWLQSGKAVTPLLNLSQKNSDGTNYLHWSEATCSITPHGLAGNLQLPEPLFRDALLSIADRAYKQKLEELTASRWLAHWVPVSNCKPANRATVLTLDHDSVKPIRVCTYYSNDVLPQQRPGWWDTTAEQFTLPTRWMLIPSLDTALQQIVVNKVPTSHWPTSHDLAQQIQVKIPAAACTHERGHLFNAHKQCQWCHRDQLEILTRELADSVLANG